MYWTSKMLALCGVKVVWGGRSCVPVVQSQVSRVYPAGRVLARTFTPSQLLLTASALSQKGALRAPSPDNLLPQKKPVDSR